MADIRPFCALRPRPELAEKVASPPYDVLNSEEAREMAGDNPISFLHVTKPEIDLRPEVSPYAPEVYAKGVENLQRLIQEEVLIRDPHPCFYLYQQRMGGHVQAGLVAGASVDEYDQNLIRKHEHTRPDKEEDRTRHIEALNANTGPVFLTYKRRDTVDQITEQIRARKPDVDFTSSDGVQHTLWVVADGSTIQALKDSFAAISILYVADGHHRSASASNVAATRRAANRGHTGREPYNYFLSVIFPDDQMMILDYNRVVFDLKNLNEQTFLEKIRRSFDISPADDPKPSRPLEFGMYLKDRWYRLTARDGTYPANDPVNSLDVAVLQNNLLAPILGIEDPRSDSRIDFVGGIRGLKELEKRVAGGAAVAFALYPTSISQLMAIADAGEVMPPKSTWFEPKLRSGLIIRPLDDRS
ncbi:MAG: DUF1015 family protein [Candidatus Eisenbacteria bacterium]|uniref:DUF1015 family protein n=1 Tax=Eiseniibacteriota bacterium TaxID=2212470 RepID=A0A948RSY7_UNCEI|nr:DUF1015 family protein [Candidatus Eisenbacteria bacterium]MBU1949365.1 DUF1015 family protein [Candidatus Eisenbacteria bacterium]MBU2690438.1 DUF1015 family protein [Candidatus Eisenbacteria bacterium]